MDFYEDVEQWDYPEEALSQEKMGAEKAHPKRRAYGLYLKRLCLGLTVGALFAGVSILTPYVLETTHAPPPTVFLEIKALDQAGHPIAGAEVIVDQKKWGVTDAFGEWRRYMEFPKRDQISIELKKNGLSPLEGGKRVPLKKPKDNTRDIKLKVPIRLQKVQKLKRAKALHQGKVETFASGLKGEPKDRYDQLYLSFHKKAKITDQSSLHFYNRYRTQVISKIEHAFQSQGMTLAAKGAPLQLEISYLPQKGRSGFIRGDLHYLKQGKWHHRAFLRRFHKTAEDTAMDLINTFKAHIPIPIDVYQEKDRFYALTPQSSPFWGLSSQWLLKRPQMEPAPLQWDLKTKRLELITLGQPACADGKPRCTLRTLTLDDKPPHNGWVKGALRLPAGIPKGATLFVSGFAAEAKSQDIWEFWGKPDAKANLTIANQKEILLRKQIRMNPDVPTLVVTEHARLAKR